MAARCNRISQLLDQIRLQIRLLRPSTKYIFLTPVALPSARRALSNGRNGISLASYPAEAPMHTQ